MAVESGPTLQAQGGHAELSKSLLLSSVGSAVSPGMVAEYNKPTVEAGLLSVWALRPDAKSVSYFVIGVMNWFRSTSRTNFHGFRFR